MKKLYSVQLTPVDIADLQLLLHRGHAPARVQTHARILLLADQGQLDPAIAAALGCSSATVQRTRQRFVQAGLAAALHDQPRSGRPPRLTAEVDAHLTHLACSPPPPGRSRWTLALLAEQLLLLEVTDQISLEAIRQRLKKTPCTPGW
jgi:transposase